MREDFQVPGGKPVAGFPARIVKDLSDDERAQVLQSAKNTVGYVLSFTH